MMKIENYKVEGLVENKIVTKDKLSNGFIGVVECDIENFEKSFLDSYTELPNGLYVPGGIEFSEFHDLVIGKSKAGIVKMIISKYDNNLIASCLYNRGSKHTQVVTYDYDERRRVTKMTVVDSGVAQNSHVPFSRTDIHETFYDDEDKTSKTRLIRDGSLLGTFETKWNYGFNKKELEVYRNIKGEIEKITKFEYDYKGNETQYITQKL